MRADNYFVQVPDWLSNSAVSDGAIRLYIVLGTYADRNDNDCTPARSTLAKRLNKSVRTVDGYLHELENIGALRKARRRSKDNPKVLTSNEYVLVSHKVAQNTARGGAVEPQYPGAVEPQYPGAVDCAETRTIEQEPLNKKKTSSSAMSDGATATADGKPYTPEFLEWWEHYPRKVHKAAAQRKFKQALKRTDLATLIRAADRYAAEVKGTEPRFVKGPDAWLNDDRWLDYGERPSKGLTSDEVDEVLGLDSWEPEWPSEGFTDLNAERAWLREQREQRFEYRKQLALERITNGKV